VLAVALAAIVVTAIVLWPRSEHSGYVVRTGPTSTEASTTTIPRVVSTTEAPLIDLNSEEGQRLWAEAQTRYELAPGASYQQLASDPNARSMVTADTFDQFAAWGAACSWYVYLEDALIADDTVRADAAWAQLDVMADYVDPAGVGYQLTVIRGPDARQSLRQLIAANCEPIP
jgi:hypothetical protein